MKKIDWKHFFITVIIGLPIAVALVLLSPEFSRLAVIFIFEITALLFLMWLNKIFYPGVDFIREIIEDQNIALAMLIIGLLAIPFLAS